MSWQSVQSYISEQEKITLPKIKQIILHQRPGRFLNKVTFFGNEDILQICMIISHNFVKPDFKLEEKHFPLQKNCLLSCVRHMV